MLTIYNAEQWQRPKTTISAKLFTDVGAVLADIEGAEFEGSDTKETTDDGKRQRRREEKINALSLQYDGFVPQKITLQPYEYYADYLDNDLYQAILCLPPGRAHGGLYSRRAFSADFFGPDDPDSR